MFFLLSLLHFVRASNYGESCSRWFAFELEHHINMSTENLCCAFLGVKGGGRFCPETKF